MRSNEELAILSKEGDRAALADLWKQNTGLLFMLMSRFFPLCARYGLTEDDLRQESYFALLRAVKAYDPAKGLLLASYMSFHIRNVAHEALGGRRKKPPPFIASLDEPLPGAEDESLTLGNTIPDVSAEAAFEEIQDDWQREQLQACMEDCLLQLQPEQAETIRAHYFEGKTLKAIAEKKGCTPEYVRQLESKALRSFRHPRISRQLRPFLDDHHGYGLQSFRDRGYVSLVEVLAGAG